MGVEDGVRCDRRFQPCTTLALDYLAAYLEDVVQVCECGRQITEPLQPQKVLYKQADAELYHKIPTLEFKQTAIFNSLWSQGFSLVVKGKDHIKGQWTPEVLQRFLGRQSVAMNIVLNGNGPMTTERTTFSKFLQWFNGEIYDNHTRKLAVS